MDREWVVGVDQGIAYAVCPVCNTVYPIKVLFTATECSECHTHMVTLSKKGSRDEQHRSLSSPD